VEGSDPPVQVLLADDHPVFLDGMAGAITAASDLELVATCADGQRALEQIRALEPRVAILDSRMPGLTALEILLALQDPPISTDVLVLTAYAQGADVYALVEAGASGYLTKDASRSTICDAVRAIARGETVLGTVAQGSMREEIRARKTDDRGLLTAREQEILALLAEGLSAPEIGRRLILGTSTVKTHLHHLYGKLGVDDRAAAVAEGMRRRLLS
jgi:two-component system nitrate/nitrite response regulator NarL